MKVYIECYGCALNKADEALMREILEERGFEVVDSIDCADAVVLLTCIVRRDTELRMRKRIEELKNVVERGKVLVVGGCMAKAMPSTVVKIAPSAKLITPQAIDRIVEVLECRARLADRDKKPFERVPSYVYGVRAVIAAAEGCLDECSFCIVRRARPKLSSAPIEKVVESVKRAIERGALEIELTAQDLGVYGVDLYGRPALVELLRAILSIDADFLLRIGQINPRYLTNFVDELTEILKDRRVYKHLHIPVQSASNRVLEAMNRKHSIEEFIEVVEELRAKVEGIHIATDIIVGHPGEEEIDFLETARMLMSGIVDRAHIARYSVRPFTRAAQMPQVPEHIKKLRSSYLEGLYELIALNNHLSYVGSCASVYVTEIDKELRKPIGRLFNYIPVVIENASVDLLGKKVVCEITDATFYDLRGVVRKIIS